MNKQPVSTLWVSVRGSKKHFIFVFREKLREEMGFSKKITLYCLHFTSSVQDEQHRKWRLMNFGYRSRKAIKVLSSPSVLCHSWYIFSTNVSQEMGIIVTHSSKLSCCLWGEAIRPGWEFFRTRNVTPESPSSFFGNSAAPLHQKRPKSLNQFWPHDPEKYLCI